MAAIEPGLRSTERLETLLRCGTRIAVVILYVTALVVALLLVRPAFRDVTAPAVAPKPAPPRTDVVLKGESVATFAARHGLDLGELLALNPSVNSLSLPAGTKLRIG
jgi:hypothetical protein